ncbi:hypothetical protein MMSR116_08315 [Methylobacterium mesophilicum SR1.6/6]|uniref:Uncharacterized protein n=1 Tax=Methylobacterium mesophilicum SR1.6/6 TaxID=908290 RepID=A0A6B9FGJ7_9HYPH|nr:hypothetical protein [Methylobacterium mesophilicum]QGY01881.1 hypothetical protein MMSR116_08315 [Methylobacterium mesophilicum SR1.6/6]
MKALGASIVCILWGWIIWAVAIAPAATHSLWRQDYPTPHVPSPLVAASVEYRLENAWGLAKDTWGFLGSPGDNETGFIIYRLTDASALWARKQGSRLGEMLAPMSGEWRRTPVEDRGGGNAIRTWHPYDHDPQMMSVRRPEQHPPSINEFLEKYGFTIPIEKERTDEVDQAIQSEGSFYSFGRGGSVTIIDPTRGKVYFAYAG